MTFIPQQRIEEQALELWQRHGLTPGFDIERLLDQIGLDLLWETVADEDEGVVLGQLVPDEKLVVLNERHRNRLEENGGRQRRYTIGHEVAHWTLHSEAVRSGTLSLFDGKRVLCREQSAHPAERQAEKFAAALLMPASRSSRRCRSRRGTAGVPCTGLPMASSSLRRRWRSGLRSWVRCIVMRAARRHPARG